MLYTEEAGVVVPQPLFHPFTATLSFSKVASEELSRKTKIQWNTPHPAHNAEESESNLSKWFAHG